jgi:hypothetical protein
MGAWHKTFKEPRNIFQGIDSTYLCSLADRYDNPIPTRFIAPIDCPKIPAQVLTTESKHYGKVFDVLKQFQLSRKE